MQDEKRRREARMMEAVEGLGGRNALSSEVDIRLGVADSTGGLPGGIFGLAGVVRRLWRAVRRADTTQSAATVTASVAPPPDPRRIARAGSGVL